MVYGKYIYKGVTWLPKLVYKLEITTTINKKPLAIFLANVHAIITCITSINHH